MIYFLAARLYAIKCELFAMARNPQREEYSSTEKTTLEIPLNKDSSKIIQNSWGGGGLMRVFWYTKCQLPHASTLVKNHFSDAKPFPALG